MCWDGVCSRPPASGFLAVRLPAGPFALPAQATLWGGVPFKEAPASLPTSDPGLVHGNHTPLPHCPQGQGSVGPAQSRLLGPVLTFPQTLKGARKPPPPEAPLTHLEERGRQLSALPHGRALGMWEHSLQPTLSLQGNPLTCPSEAGSGEGLVLTDGVSLSLSLTCMGSQHPTWRGGFSPFEASAETSKSQEKSPLTSSFMPFL